MILARKAALGLAVISGISGIGGLILGFHFQHGGFLAMACLMTGVALSSGLWWNETRREIPNASLHLLVLSFALVSGLALYANLSWAIWAAGFPMEIGTVKDGRMGEHYWLGPFTLVYAVFCYAMLRRQP